MPFRAADFINNKRLGKEHSLEELKLFVEGILNGTVADYQISAWLMAVCFQGLAPQELSHWTLAQWQAGDSLPRDDEKEQFWIDKHSTGGVGDKTSLLLVPLVSCVAERLLGENKVKIPMISGRGLGLTGGTLDKLESVAGFNTRIDEAQGLKLLAEQGFFMMGQTNQLAPADKKIYAIRDVTATVDCIPLVVASILSKKLAESLDGLVMDVKVGKGALYKTPSEASRLAEELMRVAQSQALKISLVMTSMDEPLGYNTGHALEVEECERFLSGEKRHAGLYEVVEQLAIEMLKLASHGTIPEETLKEEIELELSYSRVVNKFIKMFESQGGNWERFKNRDLSQYQKISCLAPETVSKAPYLTGVNAEEVALIVRDLGGSRRLQDDVLDLEVGIKMLRQRGEKIQPGQAMAEIILKRGVGATPFLKRLQNAFEWEGASPAVKPFVLNKMY